MIKSTESLVDVIASQCDTKARKIIIFELIGLAMADGSFDDDEKNMIPDFRGEIQKVKFDNPDVKPISAQIVEKRPKTKNKSSRGLTVMSAARNIFAVVLGLIVASLFAKYVSVRITDDTYRFLYIDSSIVNHVAMWLLIFTSVTMLIGRFSRSMLGKICNLGACIALIILYVQYCRTVENMKHYIWISVGFFVVTLILFSVFSNLEEKWNSAEFFSNLSSCICIFPIGFAVYAFFTKYFDFSCSITLIVTTALVGIIFLSAMVISDKNEK